MIMKPFKSFLLSVILFVTSVSSQCPQNISQTDVRQRLFGQLDIGAADEDPNNYVQQDFTVLCYTANSTLLVNTSTIRASFLYDLGAGTDLSFIASFYCTNDFEWRFNTSFPIINGSDAEFISTFDLRDDCLNCYDNSGIADPSWCSLPDLCDSGYCENGGSCDRTDLDAYDCTCAGSWSGTTCTNCGLSCVNGGMLINTACTCDCPEYFDGDMCENCGLTCMNGGMLNSTTCTCECPGNFNGDMCEVGNTPATNAGLPVGAIVGIVIGVILFLAIIIAVIIIVVIVIMRR